MSDHFVNVWGNTWVRAYFVVGVWAGDDPEWVGEPVTSDPARPAVFVRMRDGAVHTNVFDDVSMNVDAFVEELVHQLTGAPDEG